MFQLLFLFFAIGNSKEVTERGGLIFKYEGNAQINQDFIQYSRLLDTTSLFNIAQRLQDSTTLYTTYCQTLVIEPQQQAEPVQSKPTLQYFHTPLKYPIKEAKGVCSRNGARLPEIRNRQSQNDVRSYANLHQISRIAAGIEYDQKFQHFIFMSDSSNARTLSPYDRIQYGGGYPDKKHLGLWESDAYLQKEAYHYPLIYKYPGGDFVLRLADINDMNYQDHIMCEKDPVINPEPNPDEQNWLTMLAIHACKREQNSLVANSQYTLKEVGSVTTLNFTLSAEEPDWSSFFPQFASQNPSESNQRSHRQTRHIGFGTHLAVLNGDSMDRYINSLRTSTPFPLPKPTFRKDPRLGYDKDWFKGMPGIEYASYVIQNAYKTDTIPDLINLLHAFWTVQRNENYNQLSFPDWMQQQGHRQPVYAFLRKIPRISRNERQIEDSLQIIQRIFANGDITRDDFNNLGNIHIAQFLDKTVNQHVHSLSANYYSSSTPDDDEEDYSEEEEEEDVIHISFLSTTQSSVTDAHSRPARSPIFPVLLAAAGGAIAGAAVATVVSNNDNLNSARSNSPDDVTLEIFRQNAKAMSNLQINQHQLASAINAIGNKLAQFEQQIIGKFQGVANVILEQDLRSFVHHLQIILQMTLLKYSSALAAAADLRTSPYILSQDELNQIADVMSRTKNFQTTRSLANVKTYTLVENQQITFIFDIPITDDKKEFTLYTIAFLPSFQAGVTLNPQIDSDHIAINSQGDKYTKLTDIELNKCLDLPPRCNSHEPVIPIRDESSCVALTWITDKPQCTYIASPEAPRATFLFFDTKMFYSVPEPTSVSGQCFKNTLSNGYKTGVVKLNGTGSVETSPTCVISLPDGSTHSTPSRPLNITQMTTPVFSELKNLPHRTDFLIQDGHLPIFSPQEPITLAPVEPPSFHQVFTSSLAPAQALSAVTIVVITFLTFFCLFMAIYCFCPNCFAQCFCPERIRRLLLRNEETSYMRASHDDTPLDRALQDISWIPDPSSDNPLDNSHVQLHVQPRETSSPIIRQPKHKHNDTAPVPSRKKPASALTRTFS